MRRAVKTIRPGPRGAEGDAVLLRLTSEESREIREAAQRDGLAVSAWIRSLALRAARSR